MYYVPKYYDVQLVSYLFTTLSYFCFNEEASMNKSTRATAYVNIYTLLI